MASPIQIPTFLKWAGGKRRILPLLDAFFPSKIERYFEPFLGAGSVFFFVKQKYNPSHCTISDTNLDLVNTYLDVRDKPELLIKHLLQFKKNHSEDSYYAIRKSFNENKLRKVRRSAAFIYLNKTCFNGLYRVNRKNEFNVPFGKSKNPSIFDEETVLTASKILNDRVEIKHQDYKGISTDVKRGDFVYLDPCYDPLKKTSFANYTPERFSEKDRIELFNFIEILKRKGVRTILSNNDIPEIRGLYSNYVISEINAPRFIGSKSAYREDVLELVIRTS